MNAWLTELEPTWRLIGWTMLHFLWIGSLVALLGGAMRAACRRAPAGMRYAASLFTLLALAVTPAVIAGYLAANSYSPAILAGSDASYPPAMPITAAPTGVASADTSGQDGPAMYAAAPVVIDLKYQAPPVSAAMTPQAPIADSNGLPVEEPLRDSRVSEKRDHIMFATFIAALDESVRYLPWIWFLGAPVMFTLLSAGLVGARRLQRGCVPITTGAVFDACERLRRGLHISRRVVVATCESTVQPVLVGIVRPLIILPAAALNGWTAEELEMVLLHELAHVRRWDNLMNLFQRLVESALFFHPAVWLASRQVRRDREECCDAAVIAHTARPEQYATLLVTIASALRNRPAPLVVASAMADHPLASRIRRILKLEDEPMRVSRRTLAGAVSAPLLIIYALLYAGAVGADDNPPPSKGAAQPSTVAGGDRAQGVSSREAIRGGILNA